MLPKSLNRRLVRLSACLLLAAIASWATGALIISWNLTQRFQPPFAETLPPALTDRTSELRLTTSDHEELGAWYWPPKNEAAPSVAIFHGLGGTRLSRLAPAGVFYRAGCGVLLVTHRGHGDSSGDRQDFGWSEQHDVIAAVEWLERERPSKSIIVCGASLGAAAATYAAAELGPRVAGYVLECPYASLDIAARRRTRLFLPPVVDTLGYAGVLLGAEFFAPHWDRSAPIEAVRRIPACVPVLLFAGGNDQRAPAEEVASIAANVAGPCELCVVPNADHDRLMRAGDVYASSVLTWLEKHFHGQVASF